MTKTKICRKCGKRKTRTNEFFYKNAQNVADGLSNICISCKKQQAKERRFKEKKHYIYRTYDYGETWMNGHDEIYI